MNRLLIAGTNSGCGKTTVTCAVLSALNARGIIPAAFKCGPDYIDPMFHRAALGIPSYNLDPYFLDGDGLRRHLASHAGDLAVIEGAMGFYDGIGATDEASAYTVARETETPVVLVVNAKGAGHSLGAVIEGFARHRADSRLCGVIFNDASQARYPDLEQIAEDVGLRAYGCMPRKEEWAIPSRHLGLMTADEISDLHGKLLALGRQAEQTLDIGGLLALAGTVAGSSDKRSPRGGGDRAQRHAVRLAVARDGAFCFLYEENLELLQELGAELVFFSPLTDTALPEGINGLYLCGGYPELHTEELSGNASMLESVRLAVARGLPTIAECGGFLYLHYAGIIKGGIWKRDKLQRFGYTQITAKRDNLLCAEGESIRSHEFHCYDSDNPGADFHAVKPIRGTAWECAHATETLYAGFPHLYFPANPAFAEHFIERMNQYDPK